MKAYKIFFPAGLLLLLLVFSNSCIKPKSTASVRNDQSNTANTGAVTDNPTTVEYWPDTDWKTSTPEKQGVDSEPLYGLIKIIKDRNLPIYSLLIIRNGYMITETYFNSNDRDKAHPIQSCTKAITSTLFGIALNEGYIKDINTKVVDFFSNRNIKAINPQKKEMTFRHLLTMTTGFDWDEWSVEYNAGGNPCELMEESANTISFVLDTPVSVKPGTRFQYNSGAAHLLSAIITTAAGMSTLEYAQQKLFTPLGIPEPYWWMSRDKVNFGAYGLSLTARDMAKIGYLYLRKGKWNGKQVVPEEWIKEATEKHNNVPIGSVVEGYGYQWWVNRFGGISARGLGGQFIFVIPNLDLVVIFQSNFYSDDYLPLEYIQTKIIPAVKSQTELPPSKFSGMLNS